MKIFPQNFIQLLNTKTYILLPTFCWNLYENDKIMLFQPRQAPFSVFRVLYSLVACWSLCYLSLHQ